jgi:RimJ/RimL family protein N-acetyltransferase
VRRLADPAPYLASPNLARPGHVMGAHAAEPGVPCDEGPLFAGTLAAATAGGRIMAGVVRSSSRWRMPPPEPFEFFDMALPPDGDLQLVLAECVPARTSPWGVPAYAFRMQGPRGEYLGRIRLRVGWSEAVIRYAGHVGYAVEPAHRGHRYAARACRLLVPLAKRHGMSHLWITCQPGNVPSRRTLERLGAQCVGVIDVPPEYPLNAGAERRKMCFRLGLD